MGIFDSRLGGVVDEGLDVWLVDECLGGNGWCVGCFMDVGDNGGCLMWRQWGLSTVKTIGFVLTSSVPGLSPTIETPLFGL
jgi:hypothetical protein